MDLTKAFDLSDNITDKFNVYTQVRMERWNFNHEDKETPRITYHFGGQGFEPVAFSSIESLIIFLEGILK